MRHVKSTVDLQAHQCALVTSVLGIVLEASGALQMVLACRRPRSISDTQPDVHGVSAMADRMLARMVCRMAGDYIKHASDWMPPLNDSFEVFKFPVDISVISKLTPFCCIECCTPHARSIVQCSIV